MDRPFTGRECGLCEKEQVRPKLLPCLHSFCVECLENTIADKPKQSWIKCPLCNKHIDLPKSGVEGLEDNVYIRFSDLHVTDGDRCDTCAERPPTTRCTDCRRNLCADCVRSHLTEERSRDHSIVSTQQGMVGRPSWQAMCREHESFTLDLYCLTCSDPICSKCSVGKHNHHVTEDTRRTASDRRNELRALVSDSNTRRLIRGINDHVLTSKNDRAKLKTDIQLTVKAIKSHIRCIKDELDATADKLIDDLKEKESKWLASIDNNILEAETNQKAAQAVVTNTELIVDRTRDIELLVKYPAMRAAITENKTSRQPSLGQIMKVDFIPLNVNTACGRVDIKASLKRPLEMYEVGSADIQKQVNSICPTNNGKAWVAYRRYIQQVNRDGSLGARIDMAEPALCVAQNSHGRLYVACPATMKYIDKGLEPKPCFPLLHQVCDMAVTGADNFVVCFKEVRRIALLDRKGKLIKDLDARGFTYIFGARITDPWKITINDISQDIYVADCSSENIAVFDKEGDIKSSFRCNVQKHAMLSCHRGLLYLADYQKDCVHVFSEYGQLLQTCSTAGISGPWSIAVDTSGDLWLGFWAGSVKIYSIH